MKNRISRYFGANMKFGEICTIVPFMVFNFLFMLFFTFFLTMARHQYKNIRGSKCAIDNSSISYDQVKKYFLMGFNFFQQATFGMTNGVISPLSNLTESLGISEHRAAHQALGNAVQLGHRHHQNITSQLISKSSLSSSDVEFVKCFTPARFMQASQ